MKGYIFGQLLGLMAFLEFHSLSRLPFPAYRSGVIKQFFKFPPKSNPNHFFGWKNTIKCYINVVFFTDFVSALAATRLSMFCKF